MRLRLRIDRLAAILGASRLSQNHWALRLGLSRGHWSDIVNGRHPYPSVKTRQRMLEVFGVPEHELFVAEETRGDDHEFRLALAPRYEIVRELGQGAMGSVFLATDRSLGRMVALKVVSPEAAAGVGSRALLTEIAFVARLQHPNILPLFDAGEAADSPYYVMPYVRDGSLRALLDRRGRLGAPDALDLVTGIARGLTHAHEQQVLHCDVKPENVLVQDGHPFVMDFGIARKLRSETHEWRAVRRDLDFSAGTPAYVSPEQVSGATVDERSDVYSLACVVYEMLSGRPPFGGTTTQEIVARRFHEAPPALVRIAPDVSPRIASVLDHAMSLDPVLRPTTPRELAEALHGATGTAASRAHRLAPGGRASPLPLRAGHVPLGGATARAEQTASTRPFSEATARSFLSAGIRSDLRYTLRSLSRGWRFALGVVLTLGLGVGLGAPVLSLADHYFLRPPPGVSDPDRVFRLVVRQAGPDGPYFRDGLTGLDHAVMMSRARTLDGVAAWIDLYRSLGRGANSRSIRVTLASASFFPVLGARPHIGRFYLESEDVEGATEAPCVVSYRFWRSALDGAKDVIGRTLLIGEIRYTIVGVAPQHFSGLGLGSVDAWLPLRVATPEFQGRDSLLWTTDGSAWLRIVARLKPGVSLAQATAEAAHLYRTSGERTRDKELKGTFVWDALQPGRSSLGSKAARISLWLGAGGALLLLLIAANLVNLFVARSAAHARQTAVRLAIGGGWRHLFRLQFIEALVLGLAAAAVGLALAIPTTGVARTLLLPGTDWSRPIVDARVALLAFGIAAGVGAIVAAWSTVQAMRADPIDLLRGAGSPQASVGRGAGMLRQTLLLIQAAVFAILLTGAAAFVRSLARASAVDFGFDVEAVYSARVSLPAGTPRARAREFMERAHERVSALPGIASASLGYMEPWMNNTEQRISIPGSTVKPPPILFDMATPEYLRTFGVGMRQGRWIDATDGPHAPPVVVINEALERVFWPAGGAIGQCIRVGADSMPCRTIVGVVRNFKVTGGADDPARPVYFLPLEQASAFPQRPVLFFRPRGDAAAAARTVREVFQTLEANLPTVGVHPVRENIDWLLSPLRLGAAAFTTFGVVAAIVGAVGLYSVLAFLILEARRAHAIRLAIGAPPRYLAQSVVRFAVVTVIAGMVAGYIAFVPVAGVLEPLLFHTRALEPATVAVVFLFGVLIALAAAIVPMRAVMRTDVMGVLREQ